MSDSGPRIGIYLAGAAALALVIGIGDRYAGTVSPAGATDTCPAPGIAEAVSVTVPPFRGVDFFSFPDGTFVRSSTPDGRPGRIDASGAIVFDDGTRIIHNSDTHETVMINAAGDVRYHRATARRSPGAGADARLRGAASDGGDDLWVVARDGFELTDAIGDCGDGRDGDIIADGRPPTEPGDSDAAPTGESCLPARPVIDRCLVGKWESSGNAFLDQLKDMGIPITEQNMGRIRLTMNDDGTFEQDSIGINYQVTAQSREGPITADSVGAIAPARGHWSARSNRLSACFTSGGESAGQTTARYPDGTMARPAFGFGGNAGTNGMVDYRCNGDRLDIRIGDMRIITRAAGHGMQFLFTRVGSEDR